MQAPPGPHARVPDPGTPTIELLNLWGPGAPAAGAPRMTPEEAIEYCRGLAGTHYENFSVLTSLVPPSLRDDFGAVYAFCRWADDLGDETGSDDAARSRSLELLAWWRASLHACVADAQSATHPVFIALSRTLQRHSAAGLDAAPFDDLISAFEQDQRVTRYRTWDELLGYCRLSAEPVGRIVLMLAGRARPDLQPANAELFRLSGLACSALQLVNFWQDVRRDLIERGRVYLPCDDARVDADDLRAWLDPPGSRRPENRLRYIRALRPLVEKTERMFVEARPLPRLLDRSVGPLIWLLTAGGYAVAQRILATGCTTLWKRPRLSKLEKSLLIAQAWCLRTTW